MQYLVFFWNTIQTVLVFYKKVLQSSFTNQENIFDNCFLQMCRTLYFALAQPFPHFS
jgi:hypothetical protein